MKPNRNTFLSFFAVVVDVVVVVVVAVKSKPPGHAPLFGNSFNLRYDHSEPKIETR